MILIVLVSKPKDWLFDLFTEPKDHLEDPVLGVGNNWILLISLDSPRDGESGKLLSCTFVQIENSVVVIVQESRRDVISLRPFNASFHDLGLAFGPRHDDYSFGLTDGVDSHCDCTLGYILNPVKRVGSIFSRKPMEVDQPGDALDW